MSRHRKRRFAVLTFVLLFVFGISDMAPSMTITALADEKENDYAVEAAAPENGITPEGYSVAVTKKEDCAYVTISTTGAVTAYKNENGEEGCWVGMKLDIPKEEVFTWSVSMDYENSTAAHDYYVKEEDGFCVYFNAQGHDAASVSITCEGQSEFSYEVDFSGVVLEEGNGYSFWNGKQQPILAVTDFGVPQLTDIQKYWIYTQDETAFTNKNQANWLLGVTIEAYKGSLLATWGFDKGIDSDEAYPNISNKENTIYEETYYSWSHDSGVTWTEPVKFTPFDTPDGEVWATTHGISFVGDDGCLYYLLNCFQNRDGVTGIRPARLELLRWNDSSQSWEFVSTCATNFQAQSKPVKLNDGRWFMTGCVTVIGESGYAISDRPNDFTSFTCVKTPGVSGSTSTKYYSETSFWYNELIDRIVMTIRASSTDTYEYADPDLWGVTAAGQENRSPVMISVSDDGGATFSQMESQGFYASSSRRVNGYLSDGRPYIIFNHTPRYNDARRRLVIGVGEAGSTSINRVYVLEDFDVDQGTSGGAKSYPDAVEANGMLYVTYANSLYTSITGNRNNAKMITVPITSIPEQTTFAALKWLLADFDEEFSGEAFAYAKSVVNDVGRTASEIDMAYMLLVKELPEANLFAAQKVEALIGNIGEVNLENGAAIVAAREAYDGLNDAQRQLVGNVAILLDAEKVYAALLSQQEDKNPEDTKDPENTDIKNPSPGAGEDPNGSETSPGTSTISTPATGEIGRATVFWLLFSASSVCLASGAVFDYYRKKKKG